MGQQLKHRNEIDGLRAIAVMPVLLYHAAVPGFSGGFVGVDVFFVISGYLITSIISAELSAGTFSLVAFYERRARRILPALYTVSLLCIPFALSWLVPGDLEAFSRSLLAVPLFISNVLFWRTDNYFALPSELMPLLHSWSLAVEEQFYLLYPLLLDIAWKFGKKWLLLAVALSSFVFASWAAIYKPAFAFYMLPTRMWELLLGALPVLLRLPDKASLPHWLSETASALGLLLIGVAIALFDRMTPFPGVYALVPTVGAVLILVWATPQTLVGRLLGSTLLAGIGLISYSAYLWHYPIFAFARYRQQGISSDLVLGALIPVVLVLAWCSWKWIEQPFRERNRFSRKQIVGFAVIASVSIMAMGALGLALRGLPNRYSAQEQALLALGNKGLMETMQAFGAGICFSDLGEEYGLLERNHCVPSDNSSSRVIVFGDSEAAHWVVGVREYFGKTNTMGQWTSAGCRPVLIAGVGERCTAFFEGFMRDVLPTLTSKDLVVVSSRWIGAQREAGEHNFPVVVAALLEALKPSGAKVLLIGNTPEFRAAPALMLVAMGQRNEGKVYFKSNDFRAVNAILQEQANKYGQHFVDPSEVLCTQDDALLCLASVDGEFIFADGGHLAPMGSKMVIELLSKTAAWPKQ